MKNVIFAILIMFAGGLLLANAPPGADQFVTIDDVIIEMTLEQPAVTIECSAPEMISLPGNLIYRGGVVLQVQGASWSATNDNDSYNQVAVRNARDGLLYSTGNSTTTLNRLRSEAVSLKSKVRTEGPLRLELYSTLAG